MATLTIITPAATTVYSGVPAVFAPADAAVGGDQFLNDGRIVLYLRNTNATTRTVTIATAGTIGGLAIADVTVAVAQDEVRLVGPFDPRIYNDTSGYVQLTYTAVATLLSVAAIRMAG